MIRVTSTVSATAAVGVVAADSSILTAPSPMPPRSWRSAPGALPMVLLRQRHRGQGLVEALLHVGGDVDGGRPHGHRRAEQDQAHAARVGDLCGDLAEDVAQLLEAGGLGTVELVFAVLRVLPVLLDLLIELLPLLLVGLGRQARLLLLQLLGLIAQRRLLLADLGLEGGVLLVEILLQRLAGLAVLYDRLVVDDADDDAAGLGRRGGRRLLLGHGGGDAGGCQKDSQRGSKPRSADGLHDGRGYSVGRCQNCVPTLKRKIWVLSKSCFRIG